jgi:P27 family predicted phage terminase small subunit
VVVPAGPCAPAVALEVASFVGRTAAAFAALGLEGPTFNSPLCELVADAAERWYVARAELRAEGPVVSTAAGSAKSNPAAAQAAQAHDQLARLLDGMGLTPAGRKRLGAGAEGADELDEFLTGTAS